MHSLEVVLTDTALTKFTQSEGLRGPHEIPHKRQIKNQFHRIFSPKAGNRIVTAESQLEADAIVLAESRIDVVTLCEQPMRINGYLNSQPYYTFDLGIRCLSGVEELIEIKPVSKLLADINGELKPAYWNAIEQWCKANGFSCTFQTDKYISSNKILIRNWRLLLGFVRKALEYRDKELEEDVLSTLAQYPGTSIDQLINHTKNRTDESITASVANLLHKHQIDAQLSSVIFSRNSELRLT